jgi:transposase-like protein
MNAYSMDLRERVAAAYDDGEGSQAELAHRFRVSVSWIGKLLRRRRQTGSIAPKPHSGGRPPPSEARPPTGSVRRSRPIPTRPWRSCGAPSASRAASRPCTGR